MGVVNINKAKANLYKFAKEAIQSHEPIILSSKIGDVILISLEDYESILETNYLSQNHKLVKEAQILKKSAPKTLVARNQLPW